MLPFSSAYFPLLVLEHDEFSAFGFDDQVISHIAPRACQSISKKVKTT